ncbi:molybdenum cofactor biosynthesis protein MoaE [Thiohalobacter thiocyanaticus]|uniref:Molybdopterin synthase catalytic subunit n=1 Tax=Thiohalobacter thiocyanaticus TaxID=585455 RepID=A0A426QI96_9GAMM|nr:molybdenum cofactor biosynthesis protein MoaE [Thiohalobacter thiocyanaticus]RRQ21482.1 molybdenum cofactor biosynthesis protein MoaE [Thiohalobacter thiocyanaticus]
MPVEVLESPFNPWQRLQDYETRPEAPHGRIGATAVFVGTMRDFNLDDGVAAMTLEHYPGMTEGYLERISAEADARWGLLDSLILHRVGRLAPQDPIVLVAVWSSHRREAFEACRWLMEELKSKAPFWKRETLTDGSARWVEENTRGY